MQRVNIGLNKMSNKGPPKRGRPVTVGATVFVGAKFAPAMVEQIDERAEVEKVTRSEALRQLVERGLKRKAK